ncbi:hypothetical protein SLA2020_347970 [Shorea laevis]
MRKPRNVFVRFSLEADFLKAMSHESSEIDGVNYRNFQWTVDFSEDVEPVMAPVWIKLPGLAPNYYQESYLRNITAPVGTLLRKDNATKCATRTDGTRVCVLMDVSQPQCNMCGLGCLARLPVFIRKLFMKLFQPFARNVTHKGIILALVSCW